MMRITESPTIIAVIHLLLATSPPMRRALSVRARAARKPLC